MIDTGGSAYLWLIAGKLEFLIEDVIVALHQYGSILEGLPQSLQRS